MQFIIGVAVGIIITIMVPTVGDQARDVANQAAQEVLDRTERPITDRIMDKVK